MGTHFGRSCGFYGHAVVLGSCSFYAVRERCSGDGNAHTRDFKVRAYSRVYSGVPKDAGRTCARV